MYVTRAIVLLTIAKKVKHTTEVSATVVFAKVGNKNLVYQNGVGKVTRKN